MDILWSAIVAEFSDLPNPSVFVRIVLHLFLAALLGGILGYERELKARSAGLRTHMLVAVGSALFVIGPVQMGMQISDMSRVLQGLIQGIGFLGAGAIIVRNSLHKVQGLTTAANIWATASIGMLAGLGLEALAILATLVLLIILAVIPLFVPPVDPIPPEEEFEEEG